MRTRPLTALSVVAVATTAAIVGLAGQGPGSPPAGVLAGGLPIPRLFGIESGRRAELARVDPRTLRPRAASRVGLGSEGCAPRSGGQACFNIPPWSFSPDRSTLAVARHETGVVRGLRLVDLARMRTLTDIPISPSGAIGLVAWPQRDRLLAVQEVCCDAQQQLLVVDAERRAIAARRPLGGTVQGVGRTPKELVLLVAPAKRIGPARLAVIDRRGDARFASLGRVLAGEQALPGPDYDFRRHRPGLAVDPQGRRAFVVGDGLVATVDLATLAVSYHTPTERRSLATRLREWLDPAAYAKGQTGPTRSARWLGEGRLAVTGVDDQLVARARGDRLQRSRPAGLRLVDTRDWTYRTVDRGATAVRTAGQLLLSTGQSADLAPGADKSTGVTAYDLDGKRRFAVLEGRDAWVEQIVGRRAFVDAGVPPRDGEPPLRIVDLGTGRISGERATRPPTLLLDPAWSWWDE